MRREAFEAYMIEKCGRKTRHVCDVMARAQRVESILGDIDSAFNRDRLTAILERLSYSIEDQHNCRAAPAGFSFNFKAEPGTQAWFETLRVSLTSLRRAVEDYREFCEVSQ